MRGQREREIELLEDARRRVQGLPPVLPSEKVKVDRLEQGQQRLDDLFGKAKESEKNDAVGRKRRKRV